MAMRFNPPPGWPPLPSNWTPPPGWQPDPSWATPPPGWSLWVEDTPLPRQTPEQSAGWCIGGGAAVFLGALLPWLSNNSGDGYAVVNSGGRVWSVIFGLVLIGLGIAARRRAIQATARQGASNGLAAALVALSGLGVLGYGAFTIAGLVGFQDQTDYGYPVHVTFSPNIGLILIILGCVAAGLGAVRILGQAGARKHVPE